MEVTVAMRQIWLHLVHGGADQGAWWHEVQRGVPPRSHHPMTGDHHATSLASEDDTWCRMKAACLVQKYRTDRASIRKRTTPGPQHESPEWQAEPGSFIADHMSKPAPPTRWLFCEANI